MTPPAATLVDDSFTDSTSDMATRPAKRQKFDSPVVDESTDSQQSTAVQKHPLGVRPSGNAFTSEINLKAACGTYSVLPDEVLAQSLEYLEAADLLRLGATCKALHAFTRSEDLWKTLFIE